MINFEVGALMVAYEFFLRDMISKKYFKDYKNVLVLGAGFINSTYIVLAEVEENGELLNGNYIDCREY